MKLDLKRKADIQILVASGPISSENFKVLKAGIKKLLTDGKNKIVLEIGQASELTAEILRELTELSLLASELSGRIVISGVDPILRAKIENFAKPPVIMCYETEEKALESFQNILGGSREDLLTGKTIDPTLQNQQKELKEQIRKRELTDVGLRKEISELQAENQTLKAQLLQMIIERRNPPDLDSSLERIKVLELQLDDLQKAAAAPAPKKPN